MPFLADADWVQIVAALIFFVITGIAQFLQKRARERQGLPPIPDPETLEMPAPLSREAPPYPPRDERRSASDDWEEQLRRLLEGERTPSEPPPMLTPGSPSTPSRVEPVPAEQESVSWEDSSRPGEEAVSLEEAPAAAPLKSQEEWNAATRLRTEERLAVASNAFRQAANLHETTGARLRNVRARTTSPRSDTRVVRRPRSTTATAVTRMLRDPRTVRQAILVNAILQPPKGL